MCILMPMESIFRLYTFKLAHKREKKQSATHPKDAPGFGFVCFVDATFVTRDSLH